jgi:flagellar basal-body rod protein FlgC
MNSISTIANSALKAFNTSQQVTAHNIANLNTEGFKASRTVFQENGASGVTAFVSNTKDTVDISREATNLLSNTLGYKANLKTLKAADEMTKELLSIKV